MRWRRSSGGSSDKWMGRCRRRGGEGGVGGEGFKREGDGEDDEDIVKVTVEKVGIEEDVMKAVRKDGGGRRAKFLELTRWGS